LECIWAVRLSAGQITVEGPFEEGKDTAFAITGGTSDYKDASGQMTLHARNEEEPNTASPTKSTSRALIRRRT
jgi:hypothetical protein